MSNCDFFIEQYTVYVVFDVCYALESSFACEMINQDLI